MGDEGGVAAVDRALSILDAFAEADPKLSLAEIAKRTGLYKSTVLRLIKSLEKFGYMYRSDDGGYQLGSKTLFLGSLYQRHFRTSDVVPTVLRQIVDQLKEGASLYVRDGDHRVCLHRIDSTHAVRHAVHEGDRLPLTVGASSHVIRAFTGATGARYEQIRRDMYSASYGERDPETAAVACPVFGTTQAFVGALTISGPKYRIESLGLERILPVMFKQAIDLTRTLGGAVDDLARATPKRKPRKR
jgi:DNA-binding IclR family transcriptional regulator